MSNEDKFLGRLLTGFDSPRLRYRQKDAHNASDAFKCLRDQYWGWTGMPKTNASDLPGKVRMSLGNSIESMLISNCLGKCSPTGLTLKGTQTAVGGYMDGLGYPVHGYVDAIMEDDEGRTIVVEIKTKHGVGAGRFSRNPQPDRSYLAQLGLYFYFLTKNGVKDVGGGFLYLLVSDYAYATMVWVQCIYDETKNEITATTATSSTGAKQAVNVSLPLSEVVERWKTLEGFLDLGEEPPPCYPYRYPLTPEILQAQSKGQIEKAAKGELILGPWQPKYSNWKDLIVQRDGIVLKYTEEERQLLIQEYKRRVPKTKKTFK